MREWIDCNNLTKPGTYILGLLWTDRRKDARSRVPGISQDYYNYFKDSFLSFLKG